MDFIQSRVEPWIRDQRAKLMKVSWGPLQWRMKWPWSNHREQKKRIQEEYERRRKQLQDLCLALKVESVSDLQDLLCCMVLSECVYKRPASEMIRAVNKFKADFGGQVVALERVQPSSDHVPHRYLLAEAGDTLFASFIGTKQYKDIIADANILQGAIFHEDAIEESDGLGLAESDKGENQNGKEHMWNPLESRSKQLNSKSKPAAHRGFMARAKGIPALELYRLAQKKKRKLVLCGHSLGGAVAALAALAILRVVAAASPSKENEKVSIKCITFSQPPVGNAALKDYVNRKGWQHYFKSYCIPEDLVPRILSPAYFHHYNAQPQSMPSENETNGLLSSKHEQGIRKPKENDGEQLVLGVGPVQKSFWRLSRLVPLEGLRRQFNKLRERQISSVETTSMPDSLASALIEEEVVEPQSLEIQEDLDGISLKPLSDTDKHLSEVIKNGKTDTKGNTVTGDEGRWRRVPYLPSYVPFGQLYLLGNSSVESLSGAEYSKLTSVRSVIAELRERFQSHSMRSYRSRFQRIYDLYMSDNASSFLGIEQWQQFPHLQQWLGLATAETVELGHIVESPVIRTATSIVPLGWNGGPGAKNGEPLKVDITGFGLHLCTLVHAQVNGNWCSTTVESFPSAPNYSSNQGIQPELQNMRILVGAPLKRPPKHQTVLDSLVPVFTSVDSETASNSAPIDKDKFIRPESLNNLLIFCTSDFTTVSKEVHVRTRRVRLVGMEGAGKTTLLKAILNRSKPNIASKEDMVSEVEVQEAIADGLCYCDSAGVNMQDLNLETSRFRDDLWLGIQDLSRKTDLIVLVHNLSHNIPRYINSNSSQQRPALSLLLDEAKSLGIPWVLAITNKFAVSAHHQKAAIDAVLKAYQASPSSTEVINSCLYVMPGFAGASLSWDVNNADSIRRVGAQKLILAPINFVRRPFQRKEIVLPVEGVDSLCQQIHHVLHSQEESSFQDRTSGKMIGSAKMMNGLYYLEDFSEDKVAQACSGISSSLVRDQIMLWHNRLGHPNFQYLKHLFPSLFKNIDCSLFECESCVLAKSHRVPYHSHPYHASKPFHLIHSDVWGPSKITTQFGKRWFVTFIDDHTRLCWIYLMNEKSEVPKIFKCFSQMVETQFDKKISILRSDNGTEYFNKNLSEFLQNKGIQHQSTCPNTPQQNGIAERKNKHLLEVARAIMFEGNVPKYLWGDAVLTAAYLINRMPTRVLNYCTPLDTFKKYFPACRLHTDLPLKVFGCTVFLHTPSPFRSKLDPRAEKCIFIGYSPNQKGYKCFNPHTKKSHVSMDVTFLEHQPFFKKNSLQGENIGEDNFLHEPLPAPILHTENTDFTEQTTEINMEKHVETNSENFVPKIGGTQTGKEIPQSNKELQVYVRKFPKRTRDQSSISAPSQSDIPEDGPEKIPHGLPGNSETSTPNIDLPIALRKETRTCTKAPKTSTNHPISKYVSYQNLSQSHQAFTSKITDLFEPRNIEEALDDPNWKLAVLEEMNALKKNETWEIVDLPHDKKLVGCKWVFTIKCKADGSIERYKARLVAKGFTQTYGVDYQETFAPVAKLNSVRILLSLAANYNWLLHQLDVKNAFLNGELEEEVFMSLPPGFEEELGRNKVCRLKKSLYGLKQSPRAWFERLGTVVKGLGYIQSQADHTLFYKYSADNKIAILIVYVDDIILTGDDRLELTNLKERLAETFEIKELGPLKYFLGIEFARSKEGIFMNQRKYILDLLKETGLLGCKAAETPMEPNTKLLPAEPENVMDKGRYQRLVGRLIYLSHTRPDIAFAVSMVSQFMHSPGLEHMEAVFRILRYLKGSPGKGLLYKNRGHLQVEAYTDADWAGSVMDRRSTSGYCTFVGGNLVSWRSKKQSVVARSSAEAEFRAMAHGICETLWVEKLLHELKVPNSPPMRLYCDNKSAISIAHNPVLHDRTKHVEVNKHFIKEKIERGQICISYVPTVEQLADILTKGLPKKTFDSIINKLSMKDIFKPA